MLKLIISVLIKTAWLIGREAVNKKAGGNPNVNAAIDATNKVTLNPATIPKTILLVDNLPVGN